MAAELISQCARASHTMSKQETQSCHSCCEVAKDVGKRKVARLVASCDHTPCLQSCAADGTPIQVSVAAQTHLPTGRVIRRAGKASHEFLRASQFVRCLDERPGGHSGRSA